MTQRIKVTFELESMTSKSNAKSVHEFNEF